MLSLSTIRASADKTAQYYCESHSKLEKYYDSKMEQDSGMWVGGLAFGLNGKKINGEEFRALLDGKDLDGHQLVQDKNGTRRVGYDFTFSADKSVSILWARSNEETRTQIEATFRKSVENTLKYIESDILTECVRRGKNGIVKESPKELTFATFQHGSSRAGDPQLHMHSVLLNMVERHDGTWGAIDPKQAFKAQVLARKMFAAEFSTNLHRDLGVQIKQTKDGFKIEGVSESIIKNYSKRKNEIEKRAEELGVTSARGRERIALDTRNDKQEIQRDALLSKWQTEMDKVGFSWEVAQKECLNQKQAFKIDRDAVVNLVIKDFTAHNSTFTESAFRQKLAEKSQGLATIDELKKIFKYALEHENVIKLEKDERGQQRYTTIEILVQEKEMLSNAQYLHTTKKHKVSSENSTNVLDEACSKKGMSIEQRKAAEFVVESGDLAIVQGVAGAGKSFTMKAIKEIYEEEGYKVVGLAPTGKAAAELAQGAGIPTNTIDKYLYDKNKTGERFSHKDVVIIDEAGMIGSAKMREIISDVKEAGAKVILVGDDRQLQPIDFGNPFKAFKETLGAAEINTIRRQKESWQRDAATDFRKGRAQEGILKYQEHELLKVTSSNDEIKLRVTEDFISDRKNFKDQSQLILSSTNILTHQINEEVRTKLKEAGILSSKKNFTISIRDRHGNKAEREFITGERVYFTKNNRSLGVQNGSFGEINNITKAKTGGFWIGVTLDNGHRVLFNTKDYDRLDYGYAVTIHKSQGATVDRTYVVSTSNMDRESAYVAMTRHRESSKLYASKEIFEQAKVEGHGREVTQTKEQEKTIIERMSKSFSRSNQKELSLKFVEKQPEPEPEQVIERKELVGSQFTTEQHISFANKLLSEENLKRDEVSKILKKIAVTPAGIDNPFKPFPPELAEWQKKATDLLNRNDFSKVALKGLAEEIQRAPRGEKPILTQEEIGQLFYSHKKVEAVYEKSMRCNRECEIEYVTKSQREIAKSLTNRTLDYKERANLVRQLCIEPSGVSPEMGRYVVRGNSVHMFAESLLRNKDLSIESCITLAKKVESTTIGAALNDYKKREIMRNNGFRIEDSFNNTLQSYQEREKQEFNQEFKTEKHDHIAQRLTEDWKNLSSKERAGLVSQFISTPRGIGKEFGGHNSELLMFQKTAFDMLSKKEVSQSSCIKLCKLVSDTKIGLEPKQKEHIEKFAILEGKLEPLRNEVDIHNHKMETEKKMDVSRGMSMGR